MSQDTSSSGLGCNLCGEKEFKLFYFPKSQPLSPLKIVSCQKCGLLYAHPLPDRKKLLERYNQNYFSCTSPLEGGYENYLKDEPHIKKTFKRRLKLFTPVIKKSTDLHILDVGCATGVFLEIMRDLGFKTTGIEISDFARGVAVKKGFDVHSTELESTHFPQAHFDLITMWDVIEHLEDPLSALKNCQKLLKPEGHLVLSTPDASAWLARFLGNHWLGFQCLGEHVFFFGKKSIRNMLEKAGLEVRKITPVGKHLPLERFITRLMFYTRIFRILSPLQRLFGTHSSLYINSGDTMCVIAQKPGKTS